MRGNNTDIVHKNKLNQTTTITLFQSQSKKHPLLRPKPFNCPLIADRMLVVFNKKKKQFNFPNSSIISICASYTITMKISFPIP
jgi:hypothetical protein